MSAELAKVIGNTKIRAREGDHYVNATELCKAAGKQWGHYFSNKGTKDFMTALGRSIGIPMDRLVQKTSTGPNAHRGTWVHPQVVIDFARWASPEFAVQVTEWVLELITTGKVELRPDNTVTMSAEQFAQLTGRMESLERQVGTLRDQRAIAGPLSAVPQTTVQKRLTDLGWPEANLPMEWAKKARALIRRQANIWLMLRYGETPDVSGGPGGACVYYHHQIAVLDEAIDYVRKALARREQAAGPTLFNYEKFRKAS